MTIFYQNKESLLSLIRTKKIAILGYGSQGAAHAANLRDSGVLVEVGLPENSESKSRAQEAGFVVKTVSEAVLNADVSVFLAPDEIHGKLYQEIKDHLKPNSAILFAHGFSIHYKLIEARTDLDVILVAPKGPGALLRKKFSEGGGLAALIAVEHDCSGTARDIAHAYAAALGCARTGVLETTFKEEVETDLFGEQVVLCGGVSHLVLAAFETLVDAGYAPEMAYIECLHELKLVGDLLHEGGLTGLREKISNTAEFGDYTRGPRIVNDETQKTMKTILKEIQSGEFAKELMHESESGKLMMRALRKRTEEHLIEKVGTQLRKTICKS